MDNPHNQTPPLPEGRAGRVGHEFRGITLVQAFAGFVVIVALLFAAAAAFLVQSYAQKLTDRALARAVTARAESAVQDFARVLDSDWQDVAFLESRFQVDDPPRIRGTLEGIVGDGRHVSWAGVADLAGKVQVASNGMLEGVDVSQRPWYQAGLKGGYAGDVHEAVLLNTLLGGTAENMIRFIDLSTPVLAADGTPQGVLGMHISFEWARAFLAEAARVRQIDLLLVDRAGKVILSTNPSLGQLGGDAGVPSLRAAATGTAVSLRETWPDGRSYFSTVVPQVAHGDLPSFGWRVVGRIDPETFAGDRRDIIVLMAEVLGGMILAFLLLAVVFSNWVLRPYRQLALSAERIADHEDPYPPEHANTVEAAMLSSALARLQPRA